MTSATRTKIRVAMAQKATAARISAVRGGIQTATATAQTAMVAPQAFSARATPKGISSWARSSGLRLRSYSPTKTRKKHF